MKISITLFSLVSLFLISAAHAEGIALTWKNKAGYWFACGPIQCIQAGENTEEAALSFVLSKRRHSSHFSGVNGKCNRYTVFGLESYDYSSEKVERLAHCD